MKKIYLDHLIYSCIKHELMHYVQFLISRNISDNMVVPKNRLYNIDLYRHEQHQKSLSHKDIANSLAQADRKKMGRYIVLY